MGTRGNWKLWIRLARFERDCIHGLFEEDEVSDTVGSIQKSGFLLLLFLPAVLVVHLGIAVASVLVSS
ncbi:Protein of unknown function [Gryllus bimaculatus]|nr:Protein of unknown function [Gryllus bimaculatus]